MKVLHKRINAFLEKSERKWQEESMEDSIAELAEYYHSGEPIDVANGIITSVNMVYPRVRTFLASMYAKDPDIRVGPELSEYAENATRSERMLRYLTKKKHYPDEFEDFLTNARLFHYGVVQLGMEGSGTKIDPKLPYVRSLDPRTVRIDTSFERWRPSEAVWMAKKFRRTLTQLRASGVYTERNLDKVAEHLMGEKGDSFSEDTAEMWLWENFIWERVEAKNQIIVAVNVAGFVSDVGEEQIDQPLNEDDQMWIREDEYSSVIGLPFKFLAFIPTKHKWFPQSPVKQWLAQQHEVNKFRSAKLLEAERAQIMLWFNKQALPKDADQTILTSKEPKVWLPIDGSGKDNLGVVDKGSTPVEVTQAEIDATNSIIEIDGIGTAQLGTEPKRGSTSATRDALIEQYLRLRASDHQKKWERGLEDIYQGLLNLAQSHMKGEVRRQITGMEPEIYSRETIAGNADLSITAGSTTPRDRDKDKADNERIMKTYANHPNVNQKELVRELLSREDFVKDPDMLIQDVPQPQGQPGQEGQPQDVLVNNPALMQQAAQVQQEQGASPLSQAANIRQEVQ